MTEIMGAGVALFDYDNDGDLDVFLVQSVGESKLFRNEIIPSGTLRFTDVTAQSGIVFDGYGMGAATGDYNNDGFVDLLVTGYNRRALFRNNGNGTLPFTIARAQKPSCWPAKAPAWPIRQPTRRARCEAAITMLADDNAVQETVFGRDGILDALPAPAVQSPAASPGSTRPAARAISPRPFSAGPRPPPRKSSGSWLPGRPSRSSAAAR